MTASERTRRPGSTAAPRPRLTAGTPAPSSDRTGQVIWAWVKSALNSPLADYYLVVAATALLLGIGLMMVTSASSVYARVATAITHGDALYFAKRQVVFAVLAVALCIWLSRCKLGTIRALGWLGSIVTPLLLAATLVVGSKINGNRSWLSLPLGVALQPSEFTKLVMIVWGASVLDRRGKELGDPRKLLFPFVAWAALCICLVILQHDLGTAVVMTAILMCILWAAGTPFRVFGGLGAVAAVGVTGLVLVSPNRMGRIMVFLNRSRSANGVDDEQSLQSLYGIAAGGWFGRGLSKSRQKWGFLPEAHTDFIFAILSEETGFAGGLTVLGLIALVCFTAMRCAIRSDQVFTRLCAAGVGSWLLVQSVLNLFVVMHLLPVAGVPLPFISYGGSSLLGNLMAVGVLLACTRDEPAARRALARRGGRSGAKLTAVVDAGRGSR